MKTLLNTFLLLFFVSWEVVRYIPGWCDMVGCAANHPPTREVVALRSREFETVQEMANYLVDLLEGGFGAKIENVVVEERP